VALDVVGISGSLRKIREALHIIMS
jgi:hypothetical protein